MVETLLRLTESFENDSFSSSTRLSGFTHLFSTNLYHSTIVVLKNKYNMRATPNFRMKGRGNVMEDGNFTQNC